MQTEKVMNAYELFDNAPRKRYEFRIDGLTPMIEYAKPADGVIVLTHTEVPRELAGRGSGSRLVEKVLADIDSTAETIHSLDMGKERGYSRAIFVSNLFGRIATHAKNGNVEIVDRAVARVREWNAKCRKPIITERSMMGEQDNKYTF